MFEEVHGRNLKRLSRDYHGEHGEEDPLERRKYHAPLQKTPGGLFARRVGLATRPQRHIQAGAAAVPPAWSGRRIFDATPRGVFPSVFSVIVFGLSVF
jgi:hypothetical protein